MPSIQKTMLSYYLSLLQSEEEKQLFADIYLQYHVNLEKYAMYILHNQHDAEDAMHNAFTYTAHRFQRFYRVSEEKKFYWLKNLVRWNSYGILRKQKRLILVDDWTQWEKACYDASDYNELAELFSRMPDTYREPLELKAVYGYTAAAIAKHMGISEAAVYVRICRGRRHFRKMMKRAGGCAVIEKGIEKEMEKVDRFMRHLAMDASALEWAREKDLLADVVFKPTLRYRLSMRSMLRDPMKWCRDQCRSVGQRVARMVASVVLAMVMFFAAVMAVSPTARAMVKNWLEEWYECYMEYHFTEEDAQGDPGDYELGFVPEEYVEADRLEEPTRLVVLYQNGKQILKFECQAMEGGNALLYRSDGFQMRQCSVHKCPGEIFISKSSSVSNAIVWRSIEQTLQFSIQGFVDEVVLTAMAESVMMP